MSSFYEKLSMKLQSEGETDGEVKDQPSAKSVSYNAAGDRTSPAKKDDALPAPPAVENAPDGTDPIEVDLFQSDKRMVIFMQVSGVSSGGFDISLSEESNTLIIEATQKRPNLPAAKEGESPEKGIYVKQEVKWKSLYRKVYLPVPFDAGAATAVFENGVLIITLPAKNPGAGKKLTVQEVREDKK